MNILVTGGAGFIGHHLVCKLIDSGHHVTIIDDLSTGLIENIEKLPEGSFEFYAIDLSKDSIPKIGNIDVVYHLAAPVSVEESLSNPIKYEMGILNASKRLIDWCLENKVSSLVAASTAAVYGEPEIVPINESSDKNPLSPYAKFKLDMENLLNSNHSKNLKCSALRFFNVFGEGQRDSGGYLSAVPIFMKQHKNSNPITVTGDGQQTRDWIYVGDVVEAMIQMYSEPYTKNMPIYNVGSGKETKVLDLAESISSNIEFVKERNEPKRSLANIENILKISWSPKVNLLDWVKDNK